MPVSIAYITNITQISGLSSKKNTAEAVFLTDILVLARADAASL